MQTSVLLQSLDKYLATLSNSKILVQSYQSASTDGVEFRFIVQERVGYMDLARDHNSAIEAIGKMKDTILQSKLFDNVRKDLAKYEKLKDMQFVLQEITKLDPHILVDKSNKSEQLSVL